MTPRVSVVVPAYNNASTISETLDSILAQTWHDFELIIADHCSDDDTAQIAQAYASQDPRITVVSTPAGGGALRNWNRVTDLAQGEFVKLVCGDDLLYPEALRQQVAAFGVPTTSDRDLVLVASKRDLIDVRGNIFVRSRGLAGFVGRVDGRQALRATVRSGGNLFGEPACVLIRRDALREAGGWHDMRYYLDLSGYAGPLAAGDMVALPQTLAAFRVGGGQWSVRLARQQAEDAVRFNRHAQQLAPEHITDGDVRRGNVRARISSLQRRAAYLVLSLQGR
ncbi:glycosyltransferase [Leucobacter ruminantium]|uniref:Glycosyltransferase family 2 protein n=1 Tax=Leucobacter ruminantium TaxID=1289170 RepID=A0A939LWS5_9MICO|nr:glycosyltransferase family 2 protein [Leucobacter ruminantium]